MLAVTTLAPRSAQAESAGPAVVLRISDRRITESSGLAASSAHPGVVYTHNDSGDASRIFAIGPDGTTRATLRIHVAAARDWEAIAPGPRHTLWIGDIGDNSSGRSRGILVHRVVEPGVLTDATLPATTYRLIYPDGPKDAEALLVDPRTTRVSVVTKQLLGAGVYEAPLTLRTDRSNVLRRIAAAPPVITDGTFLPDGRIVLRSYDRAYVFPRFGTTPREVALPDQQQGESLTYPGEPGVVLIGSEGADSAVWRVRIDPVSAADSTATPTPTPTPRPSPVRSATGRTVPTVSTGWVVAGALGAAAAAGAGLLAVIARRAARRRVSRRTP